jgi:transposase InsO family protein
MARKRQLRARPTKDRKNWRPILKYDSASLPLIFQEKLQQQNALFPSEPQRPTVRDTPVPFALRPSAEGETLIAKSGPPKVALLPEEEAQAHARYQIIEPLIRFGADERAASGGRPPLDLPAVLPDGTPVTTRTQLCLYLADKNQRGSATIWRWYRAFLKGGRPALADPPRKDKGQSHFFGKHPEAAALAAYVYFGQRQSVRAAHDAIRRDCLSLGIKPQDVPSYSTVYDFLTGNAFSEPLKLLAREGRRVYHERCAPYVSRGYTDVASNEIWVSDHMIHDVEVQNDCFPGAAWGAPIRLRFTAILDFRSRFVVGCSWAWEGSSRSITTALRHAVQDYGPAEVFYCDNGKDYLKVGRGAMPAYLRDSDETPTEWYEREITAIEETGVLARLGMTVQHCLVRHPQSKHVERFFRTYHEGFDKKFPTYTGGSPDRRPDFATEAMAEHRKLLRIGEPSMSLHPPASAFIRMGLAWLHEYHSKPHSGKGMNGRTPRQVFEEERNPRQKPTPAPGVLALMLADRKPGVTVHECAIVLAKHRYIGNDEVDAVQLHNMNGRKVTLAYDLLDLEKIAVLDLEGRLIAWARQESYVTQSADAGPAIAESMSLRRRLEKQTRGRIAGIAATARANGARTDAEHLAARAGVLAVQEVVTQRRPRLRPDNTAKAPLTACEIARRVLEED